MALEDTNGANTISRENYEQDKKILDITAKDNIKDFDINIDLQFENAFDSYIKANAKSSLLLINNKEDKTLLRGFVGYLIQMLEDPSKEPDANLRKALEYINNQINILKLDEQAITTNLTKLELNILQSNIQGNASNYTSSSSVNRSNYVANPTYGTTNYQENQTSSPKTRKELRQERKEESGRRGFLGIGRKKETIPTEKQKNSNIIPSTYTPIEQNTTAPIDTNINYLNKDIKSRYENATKPIGYDEDINMTAYEAVKEKLNQYGVENKDYEVKKGDVRFNWAMNGMSGIIQDFSDPAKRREIAQYFSLVENKDGSLIIAGGKRNYPGADSTEETITKDDIKFLLDKGVISYKKEGIINLREIGKVSNLFSIVKREGLQDIANTVASRTRNYKENLRNMGTEMLTVNAVTKDNVFDYLCDFNSDSIVDERGVKIKNYEIKYKNKAGDVGNIFGKELLFHINQAIDTENNKLGSPKGEKLVILNIIRAIKKEHRVLSPEVKKALDGFLKDPDQCTRENLVNLIKGDFETSANGGANVSHGFKNLFISSMEKICGGSLSTTPDLNDVLTGNIVEDILENTDMYKKGLRAAFNISLEKILKDPKNKDVAEYIKNNSVEIREQFIGRMMSALDNMTISLSNNPQGFLDMTGVSKEVALQKQKDTFVSQIIDHIKVGMYFGIDDSGKVVCHIPFQYGQSSGTGGETLRKYTIGPGISFGPNGLGFTLGAEGEYALEYNKNNVINASLDDIISAKYVGGEGGALVAFDKTGGKVQTYAGINRTKDPITGLNQIDKQYNDISNLIFDISGLDFSATTTADDISKYLLSNIAKYENKGIYREFIKTNRKFLENNVNNIIATIREYKILEDPKFKQLPDKAKQNALDDLIKTFQSGNIEQRRGDFLLKLDRKFDITKLSFGVSALSFILKLGKSVGDNQGSTSGAGENTTGNNASDIPSGRSVETGALSGSSKTFSIGRLYIGPRISTWKTTYLSNASQIIDTDHEIGQGKAERVSFSSEAGADYKLDNYAKYLESLYQSKDVSISAVEGKIKIKCNTQVPLYDIINIYHTDAAKNDFYFDTQDNSLTIGNVGEIGAYTVGEATTLDRIICLGSKALNDAKRLEIDYTQEGFGNKNPESINIKKENVNTTTIPSIEFTSSSNTDLEAARTFITGLDLTTLQDLEHNHNFNSFMQNSLNLDIDKAVKDLLPILHDDNYQQLRTILASNNSEAKSYIVNKFRSIFAYEGQSDDKNNTFKLRRDIEYKKLLGPSGALPTGVQSEMDALRTQFGTENSNKTFKEIFESSESRTDIIGYSAFYRTPTRKYGIGSLGDTLVYGNTTMPIKENQADAKKWIVDNLGKDSEPMKYVTKILGEKLGNNTITDAQTKQLLLGKEPLDISGKKITLEANPIFYFMGECMNESLGLKIGKITITETTQELGLNLYAESHSIAAQAYDTQKNLTIKVFGWLRKNKTGTPDTTGNSSGANETGGNGNVPDLGRNQE